MLTGSMLIQTRLHEVIAIIGKTMPGMIDRIMG